MRKIAMVAAVAAVSVCSSAMAGKSAPAFTQKPAAVVEGAGARIDFAVNAPTDCAVYVLDGQGRIVRRLAAGLLGPNAPAPLKKDSLAQSLVWDGKDDDGQPARTDSGGFRVRVALGMKAAYAGTAFASESKPNTLTNVIGLAVAPDGRLYVLSERWNRAWWRQTSIHVFGRGGQYVQTIKPFPATLAAERVAGLTNFRDEAGRPIPTIYRINSMSYYPTEDLAQQFAVAPDGNLHLMGLRASYYNDRESSDRHFASLAPDGGLAYANYIGPEIPGERAPGDLYLAAASSGKAIFATGIERGEGSSSTNRPNLSLVYRVPLPDRKSADAFFGDPAKPGDDERHLNDPRGLASDGKGRLYVADRGNHRVVVLDEQTAKVVRTFAVKSPMWLGVQPKSGAVYVVSDGATVAKFVPGADGQYAEASRLKVPVVEGRDADRTRWCFALDGAAENAILWVGRNRGETVLYRAEEQGGRFGDLKPVEYAPARFYWSLAAGFDGKTVACKRGDRTLTLLDEDTGQMRDLQVNDSGGQMYRLGPNNQVYGLDHSGGGVRRWDQNGKPLPFAATLGDTRPGRSGRLTNYPSGTTNWERDFDVDRAGNVYAKHRGFFYHGRMTVNKYDKDGNLVGTVLWVVSDGEQGPRVDNAGNLYVADTVKPVGEPVPNFFKGQFPTFKIDKRSSPQNQYEWMYGSVIKFAPVGGAIWYPIVSENDGYGFKGDAQLPADQPKVKIEACVGDRMQIKPAELQGALWYKYGISYILDMHPGHNRRCHCTGTDFEVDDFGRVFYTDQGRFRVVVLDSNGNELLAFGRYGNQDAVGPDIQFNWFTGLTASDRYVYAADGSNRRVVRVALEYAADETCPVK
jgi:DNA-binding beta-propeller fold protein YncE